MKILFFDGDVLPDTAALFHPKTVVVKSKFGRKPWVTILQVNYADGVIKWTCSSLG
jgi:hypothetical protein